MTAPLSLALPTPPNAPALCFTRCRGEDGEPFAASCAALTEHLILLGLPGGTLAFYQASDQRLVSQYQHSGGGIARAFPTADGAM